MAKTTFYLSSEEQAGCSDNKSVLGLEGLGSEEAMEENTGCRVANIRCIVCLSSSQMLSYLQNKGTRVEPGGFLIFPRNSILP
jgi:hypothetical protein